MNNDGNPGARGSNAQLGPLPEPDYPAGAEGMLGEDCWTRAQVLALLAAERERCAKLVEQVADDCDAWRPLDGTRGVALRAAAVRIRGA